jgi:hypothetical protein
MTVLAVAIAWMGGVAVVLALDPRARGSRLLGLAFPFGFGACALALGALSALDVAWSPRAVFNAIALLFAAATAAAALRIRRAAPAEQRPEPARGSAVLAAAGWGLVAAMVAGHALFATLAPPGEWDFWSIWGLKGKLFHEAGGIDWTWLERPANAFAHPDYPPLLPLGYAFAAALAGAWPERELGLLFTAFAASALVLLERYVRDASGSRLLSAAAMLAAAGPVLSVPVGLADLPLLVYGGIAMLELRSAAVNGREARLGVAAAALALAALTKNEGIALVAAVAIAVAVARRWRLLLALAPAGLAAAAWVAIRSAHGLGTDLFAGEAAARFGSALAAPGELLAALRNNPPDYPFFWIAAVLSIVLAGKARLARERVVLIALGVQLAFFLAAYLVTPRDVAWHVATSWPRLAAQLVLPVVFLAGLFAGEILTSRRAAP